MSEPSFRRRFGIVDGAPIFSDFPDRARVGLLYILRSFITRQALNQHSLQDEILRIARHVPEHDERPALSIELLQQLRWFECFELCERVCSTLLEPVTRYSDFEGDLEEIESIEELRASFTREMNQLLWEENIGYEFTGCLFKRRGRPQTQKNIQRATAKVLSEERLRPVAKLFVKALDHFEKFPEPDLENCVKDALISLEACVDIVTDEDASNNFNKAMKALQGNDEGQIPAPISQAMIKIQAYRGSGQGAGHAALSGNRIDETDAELVLSATAAFITYLVDTFPAEEDDIPF